MFLVMFLLFRSCQSYGFAGQRQRTNALTISTIPLTGYLIRCASQMHSIKLPPAQAARKKQKFRSGI
jgi:hypothetical protein